MNVTADTNVLVRVIMGDDEAQGLAAAAALESASLVAIGVHSLCELAWVLGARYAVPRREIADAIRGLTEAGNVVVNRPAVAAGLRMLDAGGDFADGVIAFDGRWIGGDTFLSFDRKAVELLEAQGAATLLLS